MSRAVFEVNGATWGAVEEELMKIVASATSALIQPDVDERTADRLRGRIEAAQAILKLPDRFDRTAGPIFKSPTPYI